jgi:hypothetical protein
MGFWRKPDIFIRSEYWLSDPWLESFGLALVVVAINQYGHLVDAVILFRL